MNNNMNANEYGYSDMNVFNDLFLSKDKENSMNDLDLAQPYEGFIKGNLFDNLYQPYKNYKPSKLVPTNEQAELLLRVDNLSFAAHEVRLYLDVHPNDHHMIRLFNQYQKQANEAIKAYERKYGPIAADSLSSLNNFDWEAYAFPWEMEEM